MTKDANERTLKEKMKCLMKNYQQQSECIFQQELILQHILLKNIMSIPFDLLEVEMI